MCISAASGFAESTLTRSPRPRQPKLWISPGGTSIRCSVRWKRIRKDRQACCHAISKSRCIGLSATPTNAGTNMPRSNICCWRSPTPRISLQAPAGAPLSRRHAAEVVALAEHDAVVAQDVVGRGDVEIEVRKRKAGQILAGREVHGSGAYLHLDRAPRGCEECVHRMGFDECRRHSYPGVEFLEGCLVVLETRRLDADQ